MGGRGRGGREGSSSPAPSVSVGSSVSAALSPQLGFRGDLDELSWRVLVPAAEAESRPIAGG